MEEEKPHPQPSDCVGRLHPMAELGFVLFNKGEYWKAHEALEEAWKSEPGEIRHLYRGILQVGVAYLHVTRRNYAGAMKLYRRSQRWLSPFPDRCRGIEVGQLKADFEAVIAEVRRLGPDHLDAFDPGLLKPIHWEK
jgi:predicted metal-dependent hydrolase